MESREQANIHVIAAAAGWKLLEPICYDDNKAYLSEEPVLAWIIDLTQNSNGAWIDSLVYPVTPCGCYKGLERVLESPDGKYLATPDICEYEDRAHILEEARERHKSANKSNASAMQVQEKTS
jgi:hypothetical protein